MATPDIARDSCSCLFCGRRIALDIALGGPEEGLCYHGSNHPVQVAITGIWIHSFGAKGGLRERIYLPGWSINQLLLGIDGQEDAELHTQVAKKEPSFMRAQRRTRGLI